MIIARVIGGLGNQLFQYALGMAVSDRLGVELKLDVSGFAGYHKRQFLLGECSEKPELASARESVRLRKWKGSIADRLMWKVAGRGLPSPASYVQEPGFRYAPDCLGVNGDTYLEGYWQSYRYFEPVAEKVRRALRWSGKLSGSDQSVAERIEAEPSVSIHVRRGDYLGESMYARCGLGYYMTCLHNIERAIKSPRCFVFSDDPAWVAKEWGTRLGTVVVSEARSPWVELELMSRCKHHVIANSTFSWWAAWLNPHPGKMVFAPERWFETGQHDTQDLLPRDWVKVDNSA